jgi:HAMP domain-containing protein
MVVLGFTAIVPSARTIGAVQSGAANYRRYQNRLVWAKPSEHAKFIAGMKPYAAARTKALAGYAADVSDPRDRKLWQATRKEWSAYLHETAGFAAAVDSGQTNASKAMISNATDEFDRMKAAASTWSAYNFTLAHTALASAKSTAGTARMTVIALLVIAAAIAAGLAFAISRSITGGVRKMLRAAEGIAEGNLEQDVHASSRDEIGDTARAFERMIAYL